MAELSDLVRKAATPLEMIERRSWRGQTAKESAAYTDLVRSNGLYQKWHLLISTASQKGLGAIRWYMAEDESCLEWDRDREEWKAPEGVPTLSAIRAAIRLIKQDGYVVTEFLPAARRSGAPYYRMKEVSVIIKWQDAD